MQSLSADLKARIAQLEWRGHTIRLDDDTLTRPDTAPLIESARYVTLLKLFERFVGDPAGKRVGDMGPLEGGFALALAQAGADVVGIEARGTNMRKLDILTEHFALPNLRFEQADVKDVTRPKGGKWDAVLALNIVHHLDEPAKWLATVSKTTDTIIVETNIAPADHEMEGHRFAHVLRKLRTQTHGEAEYTGRWFREFQPDQDPEPLVLAAWSNPDSFWLTRDSLARALVNAGFKTVFDYTDRYIINSNTKTTVPRALLVASH